MLMINGSSGPDGVTARERLMHVLSNQACKVDD